MTECSSTLGSTISSGVMTYEVEAGRWEQVKESMVLIRLERHQLLVVVVALL